MKVVISGSTGLIGSRLVRDLERIGNTVIRLVRRPTPVRRGRAVHWRPAQGELDPTELAGVDGVINLNGRNVGDARWSDEVKRSIRDSRLDATRTLSEAIRRADPPPRVLVNASATGYYGDRGDEVLDESAPPGRGFLAELTRDWEHAAATAGSGATRVVMLRFGMVVAAGGALEKMLTPFKLGLGGRIGSGRQWWPWVALDDVSRVIRIALSDDAVEGPINVVSPEEVRCEDFVNVLGQVLRRPTVLPLPAPLARLALGEMADDLLLASARVRPAALEGLGCRFEVPRLEDAMTRAVGR